MLKPRPHLLSTIVFLDLETTGLPSASFRPEITELCMLGVDRFVLEQSTEHRPRVINKLNLCFRPNRRPHPIACQVSGLSKTNLFHQKDFDASACSLINHFLKRLDPPICIIAHNGLKFDFPLLKSQLDLASPSKNYLEDCFNKPVLLADTLCMYRQLGLPQPKSADVTSSQSPVKATTRQAFSLTNLHSRAFGNVHENAHSAEADCLAMLDLVKYTGLPAIDWLQNNYFDMSSVKEMYRNEEGDRVLLDGRFPYMVDESGEKKGSLLADSDAAEQALSERLDGVKIE